MIVSPIDEQPLQATTWTTFMESNITNRHSSYLTRSNKGRPKTRQEVHARSVEYKNQITERNATRKLLNDFTNNTTLLGLSHFLKSKNLLWLIAWIICFGIGIAQSWNVAQDLFNNKGTQKIIISNEADLKLPSITICSYNLLPENYTLDHTIPDYMNINATPEDFCNRTSEDEEQYEKNISINDGRLLTFLRTLPDDERQNLSIDILSMFQKCIFKEDPCNFSDPIVFFKFNNPYYGNCITFNPGFNEERQLKADIYTKLSVILKVDRTGWLRVGDKQPKVAILFHSPGSAPVLESSSVFDLRPGDNSEYTLRMSEIRFNKLLSSGCVDKTDPKYMTRSFYYNDSTPYLYSNEGCMKSCYQRHAMKKCLKVDPIVPVQFEEIGRNYTAESPPISCAELDEETMSMKTCDCPLPCSFLQYSVNPDTTTLLDSCRTNNTKKQQKVRFTVNFLTTIMEIVQEEQEYSLAQFFGILGGNLSLSVGLCIISILELFELGWNLAALWLVPTRAAAILKSNPSSRSFTSILPAKSKLTDLFKRARALREEK